MVQAKGLEPPLPLGNWILSPVRLPISPRLQVDPKSGIYAFFRNTYFKIIGLPWDRTKDPQIKSLLLYQLS